MGIHFWQEGAGGNAFSYRLRVIIKNNTAGRLAAYFAGGVVVADYWRNLTVCHKGTDIDMVTGNGIVNIIALVVIGVTN